MSLFSLLSTAVAVPMSVVFACFLWFLFRAYMADRKKSGVFSRSSDSRQHSFNNQEVVVNQVPATSQISLSSGIPVHHEPVPAFASGFESSTSDTLTYQPLSAYLSDSAYDEGPMGDGLQAEISTLVPNTTSVQFHVKDIPGINSAMERELYDLGYTSVEQIARWGRADVRAVSANLGVDQQIIEDEWIAGARLILSIR